MDHAADAVARTTAASATRSATSTRGDDHGRAATFERGDRRCAPSASRRRVRPSRTACVRRARRADGAAASPSPPSPPVTRYARIAAQLRRASRRGHRRSAEARDRRRPVAQRDLALAPSATQLGGERAGIGVGDAIAARSTSVQRSRGCSLAMTRPSPHTVARASGARSSSPATTWPPRVTSHSRGGHASPDVRERARARACAQAGSPARAITACGSSASPSANTTTPRQPRSASTRSQGASPSRRAPRDGCDRARGLVARADDEPVAGGGARDRGRARRPRRHETSSGGSAPGTGSSASSARLPGIAAERDEAASGASSAASRA